MTSEDRRYRVYVVRLRSSVWNKSRKYREANPQYQEGRPHVYVGSTGRTPEERFEKHMAGGKGSSRLVKRFGRRLWPWAYEKLPTFADRTSAEALEAETAERFRAKGWGVWYNSRPIEAGLRQRSSEELSQDKLDRYANTVLEIGDGPDVIVDLRRRLSGAEIATLEEVCSEPFTVITADNPFGQDQPADANGRATARLRASLEAADLPFVAATGRDPADTHREAGFAVAGALEPVLELALEFGQDAVFRYERNSFLLVESATGRRHVLPLEKEGDLEEEKP